MRGLVVHYPQFIRRSDFPEASWPGVQEEEAALPKGDAKFFQSLVESSPDLLLVVGNDGKMRFASEALLKLLGLEAKDLRGRAIQGRIHPEDWAPFQHALSRTDLSPAKEPPVPCRLKVDRGQWQGLFATLLHVPAGAKGHLVHFGSPTADTPWETGAFRQAVEQCGELVFVTDREGVILYVNPSFEQLTGFSREEAIGKTARILKSGLHPHEFYERLWTTLLSGQTYRTRVINRKKDGELFYEEKVVTPIFGRGGEITHFVSTGKGLSERMRAESDLRTSEERYALAAAGANDGLWDWDLRLDRVFFSERWRGMLGLGEDEMSSAPEDWLQRIHPDDLAAAKAKLEAHLRGDTPHFEHEHRILHRDGGYRWMLTRGLAVRDSEGKAYRMAGSQTDITVRKQAEERLVYDALHDALTGLPNRVLFMDRLEQAIARTSRREGYEFAVLFMDLDRFKVVNDSLGHMVGDQLLVEMARRLEACLRPADTVARLGGDEFVVLLEDMRSAHDATVFADRIQKALKSAFDLDGREVFTTASIGIALSGIGYRRAEEMLRDADIAMYKAKALGKARSAVFDRAMHSGAVALLELETELRRAADAMAFSVVYQPIVALEDRRIAGFEALLRWPHPQKGLIPPAKFIPLAEETGLIVPIGLWVLREACRQLRVWQGAVRRGPALTMSVNLSSVQLLQPELTMQIDLMLREYGLDGATLKLEITESAIVEHAQYALEMLRQLKAQNVRLAIDDFGTGYSSMSYLRRYPIDTVKVDQSFVAKITTDEESLEIVRSIITMAHNLKLDVVAEGVETKEQLDLLKSLNCEYGQGYYFSRPIERDAAEVLLLSHAAGGRT